MSNSGAAACAPPHIVNTSANTLRAMPAAIQHQPFKIDSNSPDTTVRLPPTYSLHLFRYAIRCLGAWVAQARAAGADALIFRMTTLRAPAETSVAIRRHRERSCRLLVTARGRGLGTRQAHGPLRCKGGNRQHYRDNDAQNKPHNETSVFELHINAQRYVWDAGPGGDSSTD
jgi:hypothetical protein